MRTAQLLKHFTHGVVIVGVIVAVRSYAPASIEFWAVIFVSLLVWLLLRLIANMGQLVYEIRNDSLRMLASVERALHQSNALAKEIRDLLDTDTEVRDRK
jgi:ABC-type multidrug transport system fused ATPase/permease subunit